MATMVRTPGRASARRRHARSAAVARGARRSREVGRVRSLRFHQDPRQGIARRGRSGRALAGAVGRIAARARSACARHSGARRDRNCSPGLRDLGVRGHAGSKVIAITGTNGKTTTTVLTGHLCRAAGRDTELAGNISPSALAALMARLDSGRLPAIWVLELSSFQLETLESLKRRRGDGAQYQRRSSRPLHRPGRICQRQGTHLPGQRLAGIEPAGGAGEEDGAARPKADQLWPGRHREWMRISGCASIVASPGWCRASPICCRCPSCPSPDCTTPRMRWRHWRFAMPSACRCRDWSRACAPSRDCPHRVENIAEIGAVTYYDDSKGTNVGATVAALRGLGTDDRRNSRLPPREGGQEGGLTPPGHRQSERSQDRPDRRWGRQGAGLLAACRCLWRGMPAPWC